jgi:hypothetical protein
MPPVARIQRQAHTIRHPRDLPRRQPLGCRHRLSSRALAHLGGKRKEVGKLPRKPGANRDARNSLCHGVTPALARSGGGAARLLRRPTRSAAP